MALITCPECGQMLSDKAESCPHCGYRNIKNTFDSFEGGLVSSNEPRPQSSAEADLLKQSSMNTFQLKEESADFWSSEKLRNGLLVADAILACVALILAIILLCGNCSGSSSSNGDETVVDTLVEIEEDVVEAADEETEEYLITSKGIGDLVLGETSYYEFCSTPASSATPWLEEERHFSNRFYDKSVAVFNAHDDVVDVCLSKGKEGLCGLAFDDEDKLCYISVDSDKLHTKDGVHVGMSVDEFVSKTGCSKFIIDAKSGLSAVFICPSFNGIVEAYDNDGYLVNIWNYDSQSERDASLICGRGYKVERIELCPWMYSRLCRN